MTEHTKEVVIAIWLLFILALVIFAATTGSAQNIEGQPIASQYSTWQVSGYAPDTYTFAPNACRVQGGASFFNAFAVGTPIKIVDGNPALTETVTPTNVISSNNACSISIAPVNHHNLPYYLTSATGGLQEALNANYKSPSVNTIILDNKFYVAAGSASVASIIASAIGFSNLGLVDITQTPYVWYQWNGSQYVKSSVGGDVTSVFDRTGAVTAQSGDYTCLEVTGCGAEPNAYLSTTLATSISATNTVMPLATTPASLTTAGVVVIDSEWIAYSGISGNNLTGATRGYHQTTAATHASGAAVNSVLADFTNPAQTPLNYLIAGEGPETTLLVIGCATPNESGQVFVQFGCAGTDVEINDGRGIDQNEGEAENKLQAPTGIGPGGGLAPIINSGYLFDSMRQNNSTVTQGFQAGLATLVSAVQPPTIAAPTLINLAGIGSTTYSYECTGTDVDGNTFPGTVASLTNGPAIIPGGDASIFIDCPFSAGAVSLQVWRTAGGSNEGLLGTISENGGALFDAGGSATPGTPPSSNSSIPKVCIAGEQFCEISGTTSTPTVACASGTKGWVFHNVAAITSPFAYVCNGSAWGAAY